MTKHNYVHGYTERESARLEDQANTLDDLLHHDSVFPAGSRILEAGCGTGAQTKIIAPKNPDSRFISVDISEASLAKAQNLIESLNIKNVEFIHGDINDPDFEDESFDHIFICFVLEHLPSPGAVLKSLKRVLKKDGSITVIEGDHGSAYYYPESEFAQKAIDSQVKLQAASGGNALIGRQLYPLITGAGYAGCSVSPRMVYVDSSRPELVEGFTKNTFTAMIEGVRESAVSSNILSEEEFDKGISDLYKTALEDGTFCYTFFKAIAYK